MAGDRADFWVSGWLLGGGFPFTLSDYCPGGLARAPKMAAGHRGVTGTLSRAALAAWRSLRPEGYHGGWVEASWHLVMLTR